MWEIAPALTSTPIGSFHPSPTEQATGSSLSWTGDGKLFRSISMLTLISAADGSNRTPLLQASDVNIWAAALWPGHQFRGLPNRCR